MSQRSNSAGIEPLVSHSQHFQAIALAMRLFIGRGRRFTYKDVQRGAGVPERMIECYRLDVTHEDWREPRPEYVASLFKFLGPDFLSEYLSLISSGQAAYWLPEDDAPPPAEIAADIADDCAKVTRWAHSGRSDAGTSDMRTIGTRMITRGAGLVKMAAAA